MARCYSVPVPIRQPSHATSNRSAARIGTLARLWLISDARNDAVLERALKRLPRGCGFVFRHYHLPPDQRRARFDCLLRLARSRGHVAVLAGDAASARGWGADGAYGSPRQVARGGAMMRLITVHSPRELTRAQLGRADAVLLSPIFATASHPGAQTLGPVRAHLLTRRARVPVIALGGMSAHRARVHGFARWAAIDALSGKRHSQLCSRSILDARSPAAA